MRLEGRFKGLTAVGSAEENVPFPVTTEICFLPQNWGVWGLGLVLCLMERSLVLLGGGLDLMDILELCQGLMLLCRGLGCHRVSLLVPPVHLSLTMDPGLGRNLPLCCLARISVKHIVNLLLDAQDGAGSDPPVGRESSSPCSCVLGLFWMMSFNHETQCIVSGTPPMHMLPIKNEGCFSPQMVMFQSKVGFVGLSTAL